MPKFYEFFAGGGMVRAGLGARWTCLIANDVDVKKARAYTRNWGSGALKVADVRDVVPADLPDKADLIWASFPCQDLSLAGAGEGLRGDRSGTFWPFWEIVRGLGQDGRRPAIVTLENVRGTLTSHGGQDFSAIADAFAAEQYRFGALIVDASRFLPQSRPRFFLVAVAEETSVPAASRAEGPIPEWHPRTLTHAWRKLSPAAKERWIWWNLKTPETRSGVFADLIEDDPKGVRWHTAQETARLLSLMNGLNAAKVTAAQAAARRMVGTIYKRTRRDEDGRKVQRAEVRFDDVAGCLRTPAGGSSRQLILVVDGQSVRSRLISSRETARLMGLPETYRLPSKYNEAYHLTGDGVVVPVVRHLAAHLFEPILASQGVVGIEAA